MTLEIKIPQLKDPADMYLVQIVNEIVTRQMNRDILNPQSGTDDSRHAQLYLELNNFERKSKDY